MSKDGRVGQRLGDLVLDPIELTMRLVHAPVSRHEHVEVDKIPVSRAARPQIAETDVGAA